MASTNAFLSSISDSLSEAAQCPGCGEDLSLRLGGERCITPVCGHQLHEACYESIYGPVEGGRGGSQPTGVCGVCRAPMVVSLDRESGVGKNKFASMAGLPTGGHETFKQRSVSRQTLDVFDTPDPAEEDDLWYPPTDFTSSALDRTVGSASSAASQNRRGPSAATSRPPTSPRIGSESGGEWEIARPTITVRAEYPTLARQAEKQHFTCLVSIQMPSRWSSATGVASSSTSTIQNERSDEESGSPKNRKSTATGSSGSRRSARPTSPTGSTYSAYTYASTGDSVPPVPSNPFKTVVEDLHSRMADWKGHSPEFGMLKVYDYLHVRKHTREVEFLVYLFEEAILCVADDRRKGLASRLVTGGDKLRLKGRIYVKHISSVVDTSVPGDLSLTINMQDEKEDLDKFILTFTDLQSLNVWKGQISLLVDSLRLPSSSAAAPSSRMNRSQGLMGSPSGDSSYSEFSDTSTRTGSSNFSTFTRTTTSSAPAFSSTIREEKSIELRRFNSSEGPYSPITSVAGASSMREYTSLDLMLILAIGPTDLQVKILKETLDFLLHTVGPKTRISVITYSTAEGAHGVLRKTPFVALGRSTARFEAIIAELGAAKSEHLQVHKEDRVNLVSAVNLAYDGILQRKSKSALSGIVLVHDGKEVATKQQMDLVMARAENANVPIHAVGWGKSHDPSTLWVLSNHTKGTYTSVPEFYDLRNAVAGIVGGMLSIACSNVRLHVAVPERRWFRIRKVTGSGTAFLSSEGFDVDVSVGELRFGERQDLLIEMEGLLQPPTRSSKPDFSSATDEYFLRKVELDPMSLGDSASDFYEEQYDELPTEMPLFEVNLAYSDPRAGKNISRLNPTPCLLTISVLPAPSSRAPPRTLVSDPSIVRRRIELLVADMLTRAILLTARGNDTQAKRILVETKRIIATILGSLRPSGSTETRDTLVACAEDVTAVLERSEFDRTFAAQQAVVLRDGQGWTTRTATERLKLKADNALYLAALSRSFVSTRTGL